MQNVAAGRICLAGTSVWTGLCERCRAAASPKGERLEAENIKRCVHPSQLPEEGNIFFQKGEVSLSVRT